jgi:deoxycytidylate deaminase
MDEKKPEIVIGLAGPAGTDLHGLAQSFEEKMSPFGYRCRQIRVSQLIQEFCDAPLNDKIRSAKHDEKVRYLMAAGDTLRKQVGRGDALIPLVVASIRSAQQGFLGESFVATDTSATTGAGGTSSEEAPSAVPADQACYIVNSLKHPDEVRELRRIYGENFILVSGFASHSERMSNLCELIAKSHTSTQNDRFKDEAQDLINWDAQRPGEKLGQNLRDTFHLADFFIRVSGDYEREVERFLDLLFGNPYFTPRFDEFHMFEAKAKSYRSADLSRQVGAVIVDQAKAMVASGCNEVPIAGGGSYWPDEDKAFDNRDHTKRRDYNAVKKYEIIEEMISFMAAQGVMQFNKQSSATEVVEKLLFGSSSTKFKDLRVSNLIEFGRVVHAEMNAITEAARRGIAIGGGTLYCTTFPCHMCARHVISAGIKKVVYIEPYPKSMTADLYDESVTIDGDSGRNLEDERSPHPKVVFEPFEGVAPSLYTDLYKAGTRKNSRGYTIEWSRQSARPKSIRTAAAHISLEAPLFKQLEELEEVGLEGVQGD